MMVYNPERKRYETLYVLRQDLDVPFLRLLVSRVPADLVRADTLTLWVVQESVGPDQGLRWAPEGGGLRC